MTITQQLDYIASVFAARETISAESAEKAMDLLDQAPIEALEMIVARKIKFLWMPARRRLMERTAAK